MGSSLATTLEQERWADLMCSRPNHYQILSDTHRILKCQINLRNIIFMLSFQVNAMSHWLWSSCYWWDRRIVSAVNQLNVLGFCHSPVNFCAHSRTCACPFLLACAHSRSHAYTPTYATCTHINGRTTTAKYSYEMFSSWSLSRDVLPYLDYDQFWNVTLLHRRPHNYRIRWKWYRMF